MSCIPVYASLEHYFTAQMTADRQVQVPVIRADKLIRLPFLMCMILYGSLTVAVNIAHSSILHRVTRSPEQASMQQVKRVAACYAG